MENMKMSVQGGQMQFSQLTSEFDEKEFATRKAYVWMHMLNDSMKPIKWLKTTKKGTKVNFESIKTQEEYDSGLDQLNAFLSGVNRQFGTDYKLNKEG
jgi:hypothetical protein